MHEGKKVVQSFVLVSVTAFISLLAVGLVCWAVTTIEWVDDDESEGQSRSQPHQAEG